MRSIKHWMQVCKEEHEGCRKLNSKDSSPFSLPTRLLDIRPNPTDTIKLISSATLPSPVPYMTLSYCWGTAPATSQLRTTRATLATHQDRGIPFSSLPLTFQQTIQIARLLSISHLWIDALCIIQSDVEDWHAEAPRMQDVYGHSYLNVSASASTSPDGGLFRGRDARHLDISLVPGPIGDRGVGQRFAVVHKDYWEAQLLESKLYSRAWVFQERMLSPRLLHFADEQIFFECPCLQACEAFPTGLPTQLLTRPKRDLQWKRELQRGTFERTLTDQERRGIPFEHFWTTAVRSYSSCDLTNGADKIVALSGISTLIARAVKDVDEYLSGMWRLMLEEQLGWRVVDARQHNGKPSRRMSPEEYRAPSWSWASMDGVIEMPSRVRQRRDYVLRILEHGEQVTETASESETKTLGNQKRFLLVEGLVYRLDFCKEPVEGSEWVLVDPADRKIQMTNIRAYFDVDRGEAAGNIASTLVLVTAYTKNSF
ncbi:hypothetical protein B9Z65_2667 [Elsinoe australis]|uniref:Heterokaryon incompatibility domain-containing protein n=1 Tax=Elsinoe australis TaxID=40998 RepID=A0A2P8A4C1_9PEZI|nr:hypothetical protein B9Z65_2667 [Elsinoe australis]